MNDAYIIWKGKWWCCYYEVGGDIDLWDDLLVEDNIFDEADMWKPNG